MQFRVVNWGKEAAEDRELFLQREDGDGRRVWEKHPPSKKKKKAA